MGDRILMGEGAPADDDCTEANDCPTGLGMSPRRRPRVSFERRREINALALKVSHELKTHLKTQLERRVFYKMLDELIDLDDQ